MRTCPKCKQERDDSQFLRNQYWCKPCRAEYMREFKRLHPSYAREYQQAHVSEYKEASLRYEERNYERRKREKKEYNRTHAEHIKVKRNEYRRREYKNNPEFKLLYVLRSRLNHALKCAKGGKVSKKIQTKAGIGCSILELKLHLESLFLPGMTWDNWGNGLGKWNVDHIKPCAAFDLTKVEEQLALNHYLNLQPLWWNENMSKHDKYGGN